MSAPEKLEIDLPHFRRLGVTEHFGYVLQFWRKRLGLSCEEVSQRSGRLISARHVRRLEAGETSSSYETFFHFRNGLGLTTTQMWLPFFLDEERIPVYSGWFLPQNECLSVNFFPGKTAWRYGPERDPEQYAVELRNGQGLFEAGTILHLSPNAKLEPGSLVLSFDGAGACHLFRLGADPAAEALCKNNLRHKVIWIQPQ
jgi:transcriptional regulator with XRE-family HTH domain